jgi:ABC-type transport system involved in multi-copper enzyme maturation permease subunit
MASWIHFPKVLVFDSPILNRELRVLLRSRRAFFWLGLYLVVLFVVFTIAWSTVSERNRDTAARSLFFSIIITQTILFNLLAPILTAGSLAGEHERRTFDLLATTPLSGFHVVLAKCFSAVCYVILLIFATIPVLAITFLLGGISWVEAVVSSIGVLMGVLVSGMIGVACSAWIRRTFIALMAALALVIGGSLSCSCTGGFLALPVALMGGGFGRAGGLLFSVNLIISTGVQLVIFAGLTLLARNGYLAGSRAMRVRPKKIIHNPVVLRDRRRRYPYYLIDPLKAPDPIRDDENPMYVKDLRHQPLGRMDFLIRISYLCLFMSLWLGFLLGAATDLGYRSPIFRAIEGVFEPMLGVSQFVVVLILIGAPLFAAAAFTSEKEHGTFTALMTTLISPAEIVWCKMKIILRYSLFLIGALYLPAFGVFLAMGGSAAGFLLSLALLTPFYVVVILATGLLGLLVSARSRRNVTSMTVTYLIVVLCCFGPWVIHTVLDIIWQMSSQIYRSNSGSLLEFFAALPFTVLGLLARFLVRTVGPLISPFLFLSKEPEGLNAVGCLSNPATALFWFVAWAVILAVLFRSTVGALRRSLTADLVRRA